jgi:glycosyltransferase involved in cell wall biosynthesis
VLATDGDDADQAPGRHSGDDSGQRAGQWRTADRLEEAVVLGRGLRNLWRLQRARGYDLIQADLPLAGVLARAVGRRQGVPVVYTEHNLQERYHPLTGWLNARTYGWNEAVVAVSEEVAASVARHGLDGRTRLVTVPNGVPVEAVRAEAGNVDGLRAELGIPADHQVVGTVAVLRRQKRLADWLAVAARAAAEREDVTFLLVGDGPEAEALRARARTLGLGERLRMPGFRPDGRRLLGLMDLYLMTSDYEGLPVALLEAMALGVPAVATAVGGIPAVMEEGQDGFLTPVGAVDELARRTVDLLDDLALSRRMGEAAARKIEEGYHIRQRVRRLEDLYLEILERPGTRRAARG